MAMPGFLATAVMNFMQALGASLRSIERCEHIQPQINQPDRQCWAYIGQS
jgi:hypothetical protein